MVINENKPVLNTLIALGLTKLLSALLIANRIATACCVLDDLFVSTWLLLSYSDAILSRLFQVSCEKVRWSL